MQRLDYLLPHLSPPTPLKLAGPAEQRPCGWAQSLLPFTGLLRIPVAADDECQICSEPNGLLEDVLSHTQTVLVYKLPGQDEISSLEEMTKPYSRFHLSNTWFGLALNKKKTNGVFTICL